MIFGATTDARSMRYWMKENHRRNVGESWFAWRPVLLEDGRFAWLQPLWRQRVDRGVWCVSGAHLWNWAYTIRPEDRKDG